MIHLDIKPWCTCILRGKWRPQDGWSLDRPSGLWVHSRCKKPSKMNYDRMVKKQEQIPEDRDMSFVGNVTEVNIYEHERRLWAKSVITDELGWDLTED
jgi:hypothetical protein